MKGVGCQCDNKRCELFTSLVKFFSFLFGGINRGIK